MIAEWTHMNLNWHHGCTHTHMHTHTQTCECVCSGSASTSVTNLTAALATLNLIFWQQSFKHSLFPSFIMFIWPPFTSVFSFVYQCYWKSNGNSLKKNCAPVLRIRQICEWRPQVWITLTSYHKNGQLQEEHSKKSIQLEQQARAHSH